MKLLITGGTGTVGSHVVRALLERGAGDVQVLTRDASKELPPGVEAVEGDLKTPATVRSVFDGVEGLFLLNAVSPTEAHEGLMAVNGARAAGVDRIVYLSVHDVDAAPHLPHFGAKIPVEAAVRKSGIPFTILRPNNFYQNDLWFREALLQHGVYPQPLGDVGLSRVDVRDIAEAAAISLTGSGREGETIDLVGPEVLTGESTAAIWSVVLDRPVAYAGDDTEEWERQARESMPDWMAYDFRLMYEHFQAHGLEATQEDLDRLTDLLGHAPRRFEDFARETAAAWS